MAQYLGPVVQQLNDASAVPYSGAKMHVYITGTTTPVALFSDEDLSTPIANPLVADSSGAFPIAFMDEIKVKVIVTTSADVTVFTRDPVYNVGRADSLTAEDVSFDGTTSGLASATVQDAIDEIVTLQGLAQSWTSASDGVIVTATSTNSGAAGGPDIDLYRDSASPAASDVIGGVRFSGENSAGTKIQYAKTQTVITDATNGSEDGEYQIITKTNGSDNTATKFAGGTVDAANGFYSGGIKQGLKSGTVQATTSGTSKDFTSIPAGVTMVIMGIAGVSTSGSDDILVQIGDSGGVETTGYVGSGGSFISFSGSLGSSATSTAGLRIPGAATSNVLHGNAILMLVDASTNTWSMSFSGGGTGLIAAGASKSLSATLDRVRITTTGGTDTFDAGKVNVLYE